MATGMTLPAEAEPMTDRMVAFGALEIPAEEASELSDGAVVRRLVASGVSRLTAERIVSIQRNAAEPSRARRRSYSRS